jgi:hypothetical protein
MRAAPARPVAVAIAAAIALAAGCASPLPPVTPRLLAAFAPEEGVTLDDLAAGRRLYVAKCGGCHGLYPPAHGRAEQWRAWLADMRERAKLDARGERSVLAYLRGAAAAPAATEE